MNNLEKAKKIKALLFDIDGVLTDGGIIYDSNGIEYKKFNVKDGYIISHLKKLGFIIGVITGRKSIITKNRCIELNLDFHKHGIKDKLIEYINFKKEFKLENEEIAYIGDDLIDLPILMRCGFSSTPKDARVYMKNRVDFITDSKGGEGALRDFADYILISQGLLDKIILSLETI